MHSTLASQINLEPPLLSRFDFVYPIVDTQDDEIDSNIIDVMTAVADDDKKVTKTTISNELFTKYITYAKANYVPKFSKEANKMINEYYVYLRKKGSEARGNQISITPRYGEALLRLSQATAKVYLSKKVLALHFSMRMNFARVSHWVTSWIRRYFEV